MGCGARYGFTMTELLVSIAIVALLAAILFPVLSRAREGGRKTTCISNQRQHAVAVLLYAQEHDERLPESATVWQEITNEHRTLSCPTAGRMIANAYGYNNQLSGKSLADLSDESHDQIVVTADCLPALTPPNTLIGDESLDLRHHRQAVMSFLDTHVGRGDFLPGAYGTQEPPPLLYAVFGGNSLTISNNMAITGDIACTGDIIVDLNRNGSITGNVFTSAGVRFNKKDASVTGNVTFSTQIRDEKDNDISDHPPKKYVSGDAIRSSFQQPIPPVNAKAYKGWARAQGAGAIVTGATLPAVLPGGTPVLFATGVVTAITDYVGPLTICVDGDLYLSGDIQLGTPGQPVAVIVTGTVTCNGNPTVYGVIWTRYAFGNGVAEIYGSLICSGDARVTGNAAISYVSYPTLQVIPPGK